MGRLAGSIQDDDVPLLGGAAKSAEPLFTLGVPRNLANVLTISLAFLLIFSATQTTQILSSKLLGDLGSLSVAICYVTFGFAGFIAPTICRKTGPRLGMLIGATCYVIYVASLIYKLAPVVLIASVIIGCGGSILWNSQGMLMSQSTTDKNKTAYCSMFWGLFNLSVIPGNLVGHILLTNSDNTNTTTASPQAFGPVDSAIHLLSNVDGNPMSKPFSSPDSYLFIGLTIFAAAGWLCLLLVRKPDTSHAIEQPADTRSSLTQILATVRCTTQPRMICLLPMFTFTGVAMTMWSSWFPRQMHATAVGVILPFFGLTEFVGGFTIGPFVDSFGRSIGLAVGSFATVGALAATWLGNKKTVEYCTAHHLTTPCEEFKDHGYYYVAAICFGVMDCIFQSVSASICTKSFNATGQGTDAWAMYRIFQCFGAATCFLLTTILSVDQGTTANESQLMIEIIITACSGLLAVFGHQLFCKYTIITHVEAKHTDLPYDSISSHAVVSNGVVHTSSCIGRRGLTDTSSGGTITSAVTSSVSEQAVLALTNLQEVLKAAGCALEDCTKISMFLTHMEDAAIVNKVYKEQFNRSIGTDNGTLPAQSMVGVVALPYGARFAVEATAVLP